MTIETILELQGVQASYGATPILQGVDMKVRKGEIVSLIGRNGVGKTTTMRCLMGLLRTRGGSVRLQGQDIAALSSDARARLGIGYVPQGREVFARMTVAENLMVGELVGGPRGKKQPDLVYQYFPRLAERRNQQAGTMSGGEQQQLAIGRALVGNPALMLLDEPSEGIQPSIVQLICDVLRAIRRDLGTTILFVEQNLDTILDVGERAYVMEKGRIVGRIEPGQMNAQAVRAHLML
ncbi:branched-chain amino acid transport system ATP-binding protein [Variovorax boronicumulans]|uniref:ABC transporter ATP-binding protein n=1 Tax=Variovorax boronicumulans TaxID=436515 RepID=UPI0027883D72|nr:ABC transporter ATP-binding protein [Variovorax boronicumulans]MDQ0016710.1 branched-chain amino acid transport system ATP-binding protein [Variovorax boronicumulans]